MRKAGISYRAQSGALCIMGSSVLKAEYCTVQSIICSDHQPNTPDGTKANGSKAVRLLASQESKLTAHRVSESITDAAAGAVSADEKIIG